MGWILVAVLVGPFAVGVVCWFTPVRIGQALTVASGTATFVLAVLLVPGAGSGATTALGGWLRVDALSVVFVVAVAFLYAATAVFAVGYLHPEGDAERRARYSRRFFAGLNVFAWSMAMAPIVNGLALLWVAIEVTTVVSALLVAIDDTDGATEAAWKYVLIASMGLGIALLATIIMYYAGAQVFGDAYELFYPKLLASAAHFPPSIVRLAFVLAVLGFGTKMGLVPVHTWLPDAHSEAPTPISALLSGALLAVSFYAILRYFQIAVRAVGPTFPRNVLLAFGLASLGLAALYLASQRDLKRLLAYSSIEHMGILAIGMSFSAPIAVVGVLLHVLAHASAKGAAFFGAGSVIRKLGTKDLGAIRGGIGALPWSGPLLVAAILGLCAMPPGGMFRSEFLIVSGGLADPRQAVVAVLVVLVLLASVGLSFFGSQTMLTPTSEAVVQGETSWWMVTAMLIGLAGLTLLGVHPPGALSHLLTQAAGELGGAPMTVAARRGVGVGPDDLVDAVAAAVAAGGRFAGLVASALGADTRLRALLAVGPRIEVIDALVPAGEDRYRSLTPLVPAAFWYEREIHDLFGLVPTGHPRLDPLVFPVAEHRGARRLRPGRPDSPGYAEPDPSALRGQVQGEGVFTIPYGPVRSGVFETVEYLVETSGEDIPRVRVRPYFKHRGVGRRFIGLDADDGVLLAERVEGTASVAHAAAFCQAVEAIAGIEAPPGAQLLRVVHAELERVANHLDSMIRHTEGAGQAVAYARLSYHKERVLRLQAALCGHRFARGVVVPGGASGPPRIAAEQAIETLGGIEADLGRDLRTLMATPSFLDRLRTTGVLAPEVAAAQGALGPVGRASATGDDVRAARPYGAYGRLGFEVVERRRAGDAEARQWIRVEEIVVAWGLARRALGELAGHLDGPWRHPLPPADGTGVGWVESPQGELLYVVELVDGYLAAAKARTASFHNFALFSRVFGGDIFTDFVFIEASFGVCLAGVAG